MLLKLLTHYSVDILFRRAFPELQIIDLQLTPSIETDWRYGAIAPVRLPLLDHVGDRFRGALYAGWAIREILGFRNPEIFIVDNELSLMIALQMRPKRIVWYCHCDYRANDSAHLRFVREWLECLEDAPTIYPTVSKLQSAETWRAPHPAAIIPLALPDECFTPPVHAKNGRRCMVRGEIASRLSLYDEDRFRLLLRDMCHLSGDSLDIYGNNVDNPELFGAARVCGWATPISSLGSYTVALEPFGNPSPSSCQLELMAAGVPMVTYPREGFERQEDDAYLLARTAEEFDLAAWQALAAPELGEAGQNFVRRHFHQDVWSQAARSFIERL